MKKVTAIILILLLAFSLVACSALLDSTDSETMDRSQDSENDEQEYETEDEDDQDAEDDEDTDTEEYSLSVAEEAEYTMEEITIIDDENCTLIITGIDPEGFWGLEFSVYLENKTDKTLMFSWDDVSVNGYMVDPYWADEVAAGKKLNSTIDFYTEDFEQCNIITADEVSFVLTVYDSDDWSADNIVEETYTIYPTGLNADSIVVPERTVVDGEQVAVDNDSFTFIIQSVEMDDFWGYTLNCYIENKTAMSLMFSWDDVSVNDYMIDPYWANEVSAGKREFTQISFYTEDFEENGIEDVDVIEYCLSVYDSDNWSADDIYNEVLTYKP